MSIFNGTPSLGVEQEGWMPYLISTSNPPLTISRLVMTDCQKVIYNPRTTSPPLLVFNNRLAFMAICSTLQFTFLPEMGFTSNCQQKTASQTRKSLFNDYGCQL
uniref:Uncharacterized protein n=1 Tax=Micrurus spixii TaxID=129469 RepID=A0A2D4LHU3_9SAUR